MIDPRPPHRHRRRDRRRRPRDARSTSSSAGYANVRAFASSRSAGGTARRLRGRGGDAPRRSAPAISTSASSRSGRSGAASSCPSPRRPARSASTSPSAFRLEDGVPLVVPEVNGERALEHTGIVANPNCCSIPLTMVLAPLRDAAGSAASASRPTSPSSGAGLARRWTDLRAEEPRRPRPAHGLGVRRRRVRRGGRRSATRRARSSSSPIFRSSATCVRVPVLVGHAEARLDRDRDAALAGRRRADPRRGRRDFGSTSSRATAHAIGDRRRARRTHPGRSRRPRTGSLSSSPATTSARARR